MSTADHDHNLEDRIRQRLQLLRAKLEQSIAKIPINKALDTKELQESELCINIYEKASGKIEDSQCDHIRDQIMMECVRTETDERCPRFWKARRMHGKFHVVCVDRMSQSWLAQLAERMGYDWNDKRLATERLARPQIQCRKRQYLWSAFFSIVHQVSKEFLLELLRRQNNVGSLNLQAWRIVRFDTILRDASCSLFSDSLQNKHFVVFDLPKNSHRALLKTSGHLHFGLSVVLLERFEH